MVVDGVSFVLNNFIFASTMSANLGVPLKLVKEFLNRRVHVEMKNGEVYEGILMAVEYDFSVSMKCVKGTLISGKTVELNAIYIAGRMVEIIKLPYVAKNYLPHVVREATQARRGGGNSGRRGGFTRPRGGRGRSAYGRY